MFRLLARKPEIREHRSIAVVLADGTTLDVTMRRHPQARRIKLSVDERGARLTLPMRASDRTALAFLYEHTNWLADQWRALHTGVPMPLVIGKSTTLALRGDSIPVEWHTARATRIRLSESRIVFDVRGLQGLTGDSATPAVRRALRDFYETEARSDVARWLPKYTACLPKPVARITLKRMATQWGSLSPTGAMALDLSLVLARPSAFEYVLVHELCHLIHHDHSRDFWREVERRCPHWRDERDYFQAHGRALKATMRMLCG